jgi:hypothetical protein
MVIQYHRNEFPFPRLLSGPRPQGVGAMMVFRTDADGQSYPTHA